MREWIGTTNAFPAWTAFLDFLAASNSNVIRAKDRKATMKAKSHATGICKKVPIVGKFDLGW